MASQIDPDPTRKASEPAATPPSTPGPAARKPIPPAHPIHPAASKAASRPAVPKPRPAPVQRTAAQRSDEQDDEEPAANPFASGWLSGVPAWAVSMLFHVVVLLAMALIAGETVELVKPTVITSGPVEEEAEEFTEFEEEKIEQPVTDTTDPVADVVMTSDVAVEPVEVVSLAEDFDPAPLAVELTEFGDSTAPANGIMETIGTFGGTGTGGGLEGRGKPGPMAKKGGGGDDTEDAVDRALKWIAAHQLPDGSWSFDLAKCPSCMGKCSHSGNRNDRCAATAMALLPFLGRGYTHREGPYAKQVGAGIAVLADMAIKGNGKAYDGDGSMYSQGLAGIALSECYAMSQDNRLAQPTQGVLDFIMVAQDPVGGGWRYRPKEPGDTSAVGWQIMALKSGNMAYLNVNPLTIKKAIEFLDSMQGDDSGATYGYTGPGDGRGTSAVGLLCRMYLGWKKDHQGLQEGAARLAKMGPTSDLYYSYYGTQVMRHMEGEMWMAWNNQMKALLLPNQSNKDHEAGSWYDAVNEGHGADVAGRLYCTSLATMMLEVYYRHLPIFRETSVQDEFRE